MGKKKARKKQKRHAQPTPGAASSRPELVSVGPANIPALLQKGYAAHQAGRLDEAARVYAAILEKKPEHQDALHLLGVVAYQKHEFERSVDLIQRAIAVSPDNAVFYGNLGNSLRNLRRFDDAIAAYEKAVSLNSDFVQGHYNLGILYREKGRVDEAIAAYEKAVEINPEMGEAFNNLGNIYKEQGDAEKAIAMFRKAIKANPKYYQALNNLGNIFKDQGKTEDAVACYRRAIRIKPDFLEAYNNMGNTLIYDGNKVDLALKCFARAREIRPDDLWSVAGTAKVYTRQGDFDAAYEFLAPYIAERRMNVDVAVTYAQVAKRFGESEKAADILEEMLRNRTMTPDERRQIHFNLGDLYDKIGDFDSAFHHYSEGNGLRRLTFDPDRFEQGVERIMRTYQKGYGKRFPKAVNRSELPVFIVGMPRSGTSLVEQIVSSHPRCFGAGELSYVVRLVNEMGKRLGINMAYPDCLYAADQAMMDHFSLSMLQHLRKFSKDAERITDKMPLNFLHIGFISLILPGARILHCQRDPRDTSLSIFFQNFSDGHPYAINLDHIGRYYRQYQRMMAHWQEVLEIPMMTVQYEKLVEDQEGISRKIIDFVGLEWDDRCLEFYKAKRSVSTASYEQVRQPIYKRSKQRWRNYEKHIDPLVAALGMEG